MTDGDKARADEADRLCRVATLKQFQSKKARGWGQRQVADDRERAKFEEQARGDLDRAISVPVQRPS